MTTLPKTLRIANLQIPKTILSQSGSLWRRYESLCPVWFRPFQKNNDPKNGVNLKVFSPSLGSFKIWNFLGQAVKFFSVGVLNTVLDIGLYLVLTHWLGILAAWPVVAKTISYGAGVLNSFYWNKSWTFKSEASILTTLIPFVLANLAATAINAGVMYLGLSLFNLPENVSLVLATGVTFLWNFTISKFVIFKK